MKEGLAGGLAGVPTGTVTLLLADVEGSTRLWEAEPGAMSAAVARLDEVVQKTVECHGGVRPVEQGEGDSFVVAFTRASDAVACALDLQLADLTPIRLRIGIHTGEVQLRDEGNYIGPAINRTARIRDLGHGGQTLLSQATADLVADRLPEGAQLLDLGTHRLKDLARAERVLQLAHPSLVRDFPPLRSLDAYKHNLPVQLTSFVGREAELEDVRAHLADARLVTIVGSGGAGKTRLAIQLAADSMAEFPDGAFLVDLAAIADPDVVPMATARGLGLSDDFSRSTVETIVHHVADRRLLVVLDNCEHLIGACAELVETLLQSCSGMTVLATSREPLGVGGEVAYRIPSLVLPDEGADPVKPSESVQLFCDRAARARPGFALTEANAGAVAEICRQLDGIPLAIELAAARVRVFSPEQLAAGLADRFRLLTGGTRTALPRQQTLRASVEWSYNLLTEPEQVLFRRLGVFAASFDFAAAEAVGPCDALEAHQVLDQLVSLVDKSLVLTVEDESGTRYRLLETVRQYALECLSDAGATDDARRRHRDHYLGVALQVSADWRGAGQDAALDRGEREVAEMRTAFFWSREKGDAEQCMWLASSLTGFWLAAGRVLEGVGWLETALAHGENVSTGARVAVLACIGMVDGGYRNSPTAMGRAEEALRLARELEDPRLIGLALNAAANCAIFTDPRQAHAWYAEGVELARQAGDSFSLAVMRHGEGIAVVDEGDPRAALLILADADALARVAPSPFHVRQNGAITAWASVMAGALAEARNLADQVRTEARHGEPARGFATFAAGWASALLGDHDAALGFAREADVIADDLGLPPFEGVARFVTGLVELCRGSAANARGQLILAWEEFAANAILRDIISGPLIEAEIALGHIEEGKRLADDTISRTQAIGLRWQLASALLGSARASLVAGDLDGAVGLAHESLTIGPEVGNQCAVVDALEFLGALSREAEAARLLGAADSLRRSIGYVRFEIYRESYESTVDAVRKALGDEVFDKAWAEGAVLSLDEAVAYAQRGRGERKRPSRGWASLTPAERDVVRLVGEGLANKEIAEQLFISPRTVQAHLTHIYSKLDCSSRAQLMKEVAARA